MKKYILIFIAVVILCIKAFPQLIVGNISATTAANGLVGSGVTISNASFSGSPLQLAAFIGGSTYFSFNSGVLLTTGEATYATTPNTSDNCGQNMLPQPTINSDPDLNLLSGGGLRGVGVLEFDLVTTGANLEFEFIFASEEYLEWVGSQFNDVFGFFISGPGISGPFSNNAENIALVPGTSDYVSVNTVNNSQHSSYYINNGVLGSIVYDGITQTITVSYPVQCNQTYHLRIAIANVGDYNCDSGVFLKQGSVRSNFQLGNLTADVQPICEGQNLNLTVQGDNGWTYTWSTGQSGVGLKNISVVADPNITSYTVTAINQYGCSLSKTINVTVHENNNIAPTTNGVNNSGSYTFFIRAGTNGCFDVPTFDNNNEEVNIIWDNGIPSASFVDNDASHETGTFCWTPSLLDVGIHTFTVLVADENSCGILSTPYTFTINVICEFCPIDVYYENRQPSNNPLPAETEAGRLIVAGTSVDPSQADGVVETGNTPILFKAGEDIILEPGFTGGVNFTAQIDPSTCLDVVDCISCCSDWNGFTFDFIPNVITPNGDGINDFWYLPDSQHPNCAYNAQGFTLQIYNRWGLIEFNDDYDVPWYLCCFFKAPPVVATEEHYIYWNGLNNSGDFSYNDVYFYVLQLRGCGNSQNYSGYIHVFGSPSGIIIDDSTGVVSKAVPYDDADYVMVEQEDLTKFILPQQEGVTTNVNEVNALESKLLLYPNPTKDKINISLSNNKVIQNGLIEIFTLQGKLLLKEKINNSSAIIDVALFANGTYFIKLTENNIVYRQLFIKD